MALGVATQANLPREHAEKILFEWFCRICGDTPKGEDINVWENDCRHDDGPSKYGARHPEGQHTRGWHNQYGNPLTGFPKLAEIEEAGVIVPSVSQWSSPIVPVRKKGINYRKLKMLYRVRMPTQCPVSMTSLTYYFNPGFGQGQVPPLLMLALPWAFFMDSVVAGLSFCAAFLNDVVIFRNLNGKGICRSWGGRQSGMRECVYLGHVVRNGCVRPEASNWKQWICSLCQGPRNK